MSSRVDYDSAADYTPRFSAFFRDLAKLAPLTAATLIACAARPGTTAPDPNADPGLASVVIEANRPTSPLGIRFDWEAREREGRFTGQGAARVEAPERARLDLFGPRGEGYLSAAIVDGDLLLPPSTAADLVPPPSLLWGALGIFQPPAEGELTRSEQKGERLRLEYRAGDDAWTFEFQNDRLLRIELKERSCARKTIELKGEGSASLPREAVYRDWAAFTELKIKVGEVEEVDSFPPDTWQLNAH